jgi:hypothetical protein
MISNEVLDFIFVTHGHIIMEWNNNILNPNVLQTYSHAIVDKGAALDSCFGFIDGTVRARSRPGENQRQVYNGKESTP